MRTQHTPHRYNFTRHGPLAAEEARGLRARAADGVPALRIGLVFDQVDFLSRSFRAHAEHLLWRVREEGSKEAADDSIRWRADVP